MKLFFLLGNQLFSEKYLEKFRKDHIFFMAEDYQLCTYEKHHKQKILLFLSAMRSHADKLKKNKFKIEYSSIEDKSFKSDYIEKLKKIIKTQKISEVSSFEIEDKFFEKKISQFFKKEKIKWNIIQTPMFLNSRENFKKYLSKSKKPFMAVFYKETRRELNILMKKDGNPEGGKWSFDDENRNKLPKNIKIPKFPKINETTHTKKLKPTIDKVFKDHPGNTKEFWFATEYEDIIKQASEIYDKHISNCPELYIKIPVGFNELKAIKVCSKKGIKINATICYSEQQMQLCASAGAKYVSLFYCRLRQHGGNVEKAIKRTKDYINSNNLDTKLICGSIRTQQDVSDAWDFGADIVTTGLNVINEMVIHPKTKESYDGFNKDFANWLN